MEVIIATKNAKHIGCKEINGMIFSPEGECAMKEIGYCVNCSHLLILTDVPGGERNLPECGNREHSWLFCRVLPKDFGCIYFEPSNHLSQWGLKGESDG